MFTTAIVSLHNRSLKNYIRVFSDPGSVLRYYRSQIWRFGVVKRSKLASCNRLLIRLDHKWWSCIQLHHSWTKTPTKATVVRDVRSHGNYSSGSSGNVVSARAFIHFSVILNITSFTESPANKRAVTSRMIDRTSEPTTSSAHCRRVKESDVNEN